MSYISITKLFYIAFKIILHDTKNHSKQFNAFYYLFIYLHKIILSKLKVTYAMHTMLLLHYLHNFDIIPLLLMYLKLHWDLQ